jgi:hypothetical protein
LNHANTTNGTHSTTSATNASTVRRTRACSVEIDLVGHEGGNPRGEFCFTLTVTDIATGWTENRAVRNKAQVHVVAAIADVVEHPPFPIRGIDSDNGVNSSMRTCCGTAPTRA